MRARAWHSASPGFREQNWGSGSGMGGRGRSWGGLRGRTHSSHFDRTSSSAQESWIRPAHVRYSRFWKCTFFLQPSATLSLGKWGRMKHQWVQYRERCWGAIFSRYLIWRWVYLVALKSLPMTRIPRWCCSTHQSVQKMPAGNLRRNRNFSACRLRTRLYTFTSSRDCPLACTACCAISRRNRKLRVLAFMESTLGSNPPSTYRKAA
mmetsp:Transcript_152492/g.266210  ORF Transcript_152492/g.266210 Transcript_152492/m.266210 type:complete len:207 (+) Transcript_152492:980-1600(+)